MAESSSARLFSEFAKDSSGSEVSPAVWADLAKAMKITQPRETSIAMSSTGLTRSLLMMKLRKADQSGFVWKMIIMKVMGISWRLNVNSKKLSVPNRDRA